MTFLFFVVISVVVLIQTIYKGIEDGQLPKAERMLPIVKSKTDYSFLDFTNDF